MAMSKKDFIALADVIREREPEKQTEEWFQWVGTKHALADFCAAQNPRFNRERWLAYIEGECGPNGGAITRERRALRAFQGGAR